MALSADGKSLWTCGRGDPVRIWDWATGKEIAQRGLPSSANHVAFVAKGSLPMRTAELDPSIQRSLSASPACVLVPGTAPDPDRTGYERTLLS